MIFMTFFLLAFLSFFSIYGNEDTYLKRGSTEKHGEIDSVSANPAADNKMTGTGDLGKWFGFKKEDGIRLGGLWIPDINYLISGGSQPHKWSGNNLLQISLNIDLEKKFNWKGGLVGIECLRFDGRQTNKEAGCVQEYNNLPGLPPLNRFELYQFWIRQELLSKEIVIRVGKSVPSYDFNNIMHPVHLSDENSSITSTTGLIYTPIFINPTLLGVLPGYYNSAYGITINYLPVESYYLSYGVYDGNLARGKQTGLRGPEFNGYYFHIAETGFSWKKMAGKIAFGAWYQSGKLTVGNNIEQKGAPGLYFFCTQRLWKRNENDNSGLVGFVQAGIHRSKTLPINKYFGAGLTFFGLIPHRPNDSFGLGIALSRLNSHLFVRKKECLIQGYYQSYINKNIFFESALSYIPKPAAHKHLNSAFAATSRVIALF